MGQLWLFLGGDVLGRGFDPTAPETAGPKDARLLCSLHLSAFHERLSEPPFDRGRRRFDPVTATASACSRVVRHRAG